MPAATDSALTDVGLTRRYIIGGPVSVPERVRTSLGIPAGNRISGADRYSTAATAASRVKVEGWLGNAYFGFSSTVPDAATGGALMGKRNGSLLYVTSTSVRESVRLQILGLMQQVPTHGASRGGRTDKRSALRRVS